MAKMNWLDWTALVLVIVGGLNWGIYGIFTADLVGTLFMGMTSIVSRVVYIIVGIAALYMIYTGMKMQS